MSKKVVIDNEGSVMEKKVDPFKTTDDSIVTDSSALHFADVL